MQKYKAFTTWFVFIIISNLIFLSWHTEYRMVSKPLIMASLIGFYISNISKQSPIMLMAMIFAMLGDIFLMVKDEIFFLIGLGCFLIMQILYTFIFLKDKSPDIRTNVFKSLPVIFMVGAMLYILWDGLNTMKVPVILYMLAISAMVISAIIRRQQIGWYMPVAIGAVLFMISDAGIAINKFASPYAGAEYFIMITYMIAQYLIVRGIVEVSSSKV